MEKPSQAEEPIAERCVGLARLPERNRRNLTNRPAQPVAGWNRTGYRRSWIAPGDLKLGVITIGLLEVVAPSGHHDRAAIAEPTHDGRLVRAFAAPEIGISNDPVCIRLLLVPANQRRASLG